MTHGELVAKLLQDTGMTQQQLADAINERRLNESTLIQSTVSKWLHNNHRVTPENAMAMHEISGGDVSFFEFYPELAPKLMFQKPTLRVKKRPVKKLRKAA